MILVSFRSENDWFLSAHNRMQVTGGKSGDPEILPHDHSVVRAHGQGHVNILIMLFHIVGFLVDRIIVRWDSF